MARTSKGPVKRSKKADIKPVLVVLGLFVLGAVLFMFFSKETKGPLKPSPKVIVPSKPVIKKELPRSPVPLKPVVKKKVSPGSAGRIAFVLDDWGGSMKNCKYLKEIKEPLAIAILPGLRFTNEITKCASVYTKTIMLHLPMEAEHNSDPYPVDYLIKTSMKPNKIERILNAYLQQMPLIEGVNNHMGSKATADTATMRVILKRLKKKGLFFLDSVTSHSSVASDLANEISIPFAQRDIFLDNVNTREAIVKQIKELADKARINGYAIAIGHDRSLTLQVIKEQIPLLKEQGFDIVNIKTLLKRK